MGGGIFLIQDDGRLVEMKEQPYDSEELLQELLEKYPDLLAGDQIDSDEPRKWLLVSREAGLASEEEGRERWSVDHLFLDQDAIPTLVEVKRSSDTRIRREVIGQMLDYAANAVVYWPVETIQAKFETRCESGRGSHGYNPDGILKECGRPREILGTDGDLQMFWQTVKTNLQAGRVRLVFVADEIPGELRRIVEFLNSQMDPAEVLAVEIRQYISEGLKTLVPRVMGQTAEAQQRRSGRTRAEKQWDEKPFFDELLNRKGEQDAQVTRRILNWAIDKNLQIWWGKETDRGHFFYYCIIKE